jgi:hypothetical protein
MSVDSLRLTGDTEEFAEALTAHSILKSQISSNQ